MRGGILCLKILLCLVKGIISPSCSQGVGHNITPTPCDVCMFIVGGEALVLVPSAYERSKACALRSCVKGTNTSTSPYIKTEVYNRGDGPNAFIWTLKISYEQKGSLTLGKLLVLGGYQLLGIPIKHGIRKQIQMWTPVDLGLEILALANLSPPG
jgi:hypothetical protein